MQNIDGEYPADPELQDENEPEYQEEMFRTFLSLGWAPQDLRDRQYAKKYAKWLHTASPDE
jgi:hypothetical protein